MGKQRRHIHRLVWIDIDIAAGLHAVIGNVLHGLLSILRAPLICFELTLDEKYAVTRPVREIKSHFLVPACASRVGSTHQDLRLVVFYTCTSKCL